MEPAKRADPADKATARKNLRRIGRAAVFALVRGAAAAAGAAAVTAVTWWIKQR